MLFIERPQLIHGDGEDVIPVAAAVKAHGTLRVQRFCRHFTCKTVHHCIGRFHLVEHSSCNGDIVLRIFQLVAEALPLQRVLIPKCQRVSQSVHVVIHDGEELVLRKRGHVVTRHLLIRAGIHVGVIGLRRDHVKQIRVRVFSGAGKGNVLEYMRDPLVTLGLRPVVNIDRLIRVTARKIQNLRPALQVVQRHELRVLLRIRRDIRYLEAEELIPHCREGDLFAACRACFRVGRF